jgi:hypothetical protein
MANPQERSQTAASTVRSCTATDCRHNESQECHAGQIEVKMGGQGAVCGTYSPEEPKARP